MTRVRVARVRSLKSVAGDETMTEKESEENNKKKENGCSVQKYMI